MVFFWLAPVLGKSVTVPDVGLCYRLIMYEKSSDPRVYSLADSCHVLRYKSKRLLEGDSFLQGNFAPVGHDTRHFCLVSNVIGLPYISFIIYYILRHESGLTLIII